MQELEVTIIIPVYNASTYIEKCLHSILTQTYNNLQIIVVDDMSSDNTVEKCKKMQELDNRITLIRLNKNSGSAVARQKGINISTGDLITFVDADDCYCDANALKKIVDVYKETEADCIMFSYRTVHKHNIILKKRLDQRGGYYTVQQFAEAKACSSSPHWHYLWNKCFKGDILRSRKVKFHTELRQAEDVRFNQDFLRVANHFYVMKSAYFYDYNCTNLNQITRQKNAPSLEREKEHFNRLKEELDRVLTNFKAINVSEKAIDALYCKFLQRVYLLLAQHSTKNYFNELNQLIVSDKIYQETCEHFGNRARRIERKAHFISKINSLKRLIKNKFRM